MSRLIPSALLCCICLVVCLFVCLFVCLQCSAFQHCTACSPAIVRKYWPPRAAQDGSHSHSDKDRDKDRDKDKDRDTESSFVSFVEEVGSTDTHIHTPTHTHLLHYFTC
jgi:hypothetical protein